MKDVLAGLKTRAEEKLQDMRNLVDRVEATGNEWSQIDESKFDEMKDELEQMNSRIDDIQSAEKRRSTTEADPGYREYHRLNNGGERNRASGGEYRHGTWLAHELRALLGASGAGSQVTPTDNRNEFFDLLYAETAAIRAGARTIRTNKDTVVVPRLTSDVGASWTAEAATITQTSLGADAVSTSMYKLAAIERASNEALADSEPSLLDIIGRSIMRSLSLGLDAAFFQGTGTGQPTGLKNTAAIQTVAQGGALANLDSFAEAIGLLGQENAQAGAMVMHPKVWKAVSKLKEAPSGNNKPLVQTEQGGPTVEPRRSLYGVPVHTTTALVTNEGAGTNESSIYVFDPRMTYFIMRDDPRVERDSSRLFNSDESEIRGLLRAGVAVAAPKAVVRITGTIVT